MLQRRTVVLTAHQKIKGFARNIKPENVGGQHAEQVVAAKRHIYDMFLQDLNRELEDPDKGDELVHEASAADIFEPLMAKISAEQEALHDISRALMNSYDRETHPLPTEYLPETVIVPTTGLAVAK